MIGYNDEYKSLEKWQNNIFNAQYTQEFCNSNVSQYMTNDRMAQLTHLNNN
jgi:hypothetical protein